MLENDPPAKAPAPDFRALFESAPGLFLVLAPDLTIVAASDAYLRATGAVRDEILGRGLFEVFLEDPDDPNATGSRDLRDSLARVLRDRVPDATPVLKYDTRRPRPPSGDGDGDGDGERYWSPLNIPVFAADGGIASIIHRVEDVTESVLLRDAGVRQRRVEEALRESEERLREVDRRKDEFLAMLAHELRNPLAAINNAVALYRRDGGQACRSWSLDVIERQAAHLAHLIDDLLDASRITRGKIQLRKEPLALGEVIDRAIESTRSLIEGRGHDLSIELAPGPILLDADPVRLEQILANLLSNAAKYTEPGGRLRLSAGEEGGAIVIRVSDTGIGIPPEVLPRVFDLFAQADRSLDRAQGGLGIGLTLVRSLAEMHGGSVEAHSDGPGRGSEFVVRLPAPRRASPEGPAAAPGAGPATERLRRVLVVDDNVDSAQGLAMILAMMGHEAHVVHDGPGALEAAGAFRPEVMLLDIGLPGLDGYQVARRLRQREGHERLILVALTGYGQDDDRRRAREAGFDHHLVKPVDIDILLKVLDQPSPHLP